MDVTNTKTIDEFENDQVRINDEKQIVGGSVTAICYHILCNANCENIDDDCRLFCSTVGFWAPLEVVLNEMTRIASRRNVIDRLDVIIRYWCDFTPRVMWEEGAYEALLVLVEEGVTRIDSKRGHALNDYVVQAEKKFKRLLHAPTELETESIHSNHISYISYI